VHDGDEVPAVVVVDKILFLSHSRSILKDFLCPLDAGERDGDEMKGCRTSCCHRTSRTPLLLA